MRRVRARGLGRLKLPHVQVVLRFFGKPGLESALLVRHYGVAHEAHLKNDKNKNKIKIKKEEEHDTAFSRSRTIS